MRSFSYLTRAAFAAALVFGGATAALAQTELISNGSFEQSTLNWNGSFDAQPNGATSGGTTGALIAPFTITPPWGTGTAFSPLDGSGHVMVMIARLETGEARDTHWIYQDVAIPADATTGILSADMGIRHSGTLSLSSSTGMILGVFPATGRPLLDTSYISSPAYHVLAGSNSTGLVTHTSQPIDLSSYRGQTLRVALLAVTDGTGGSLIGTADNISFLVSTSGGGTPPAATPAPPSLIMALLGMGGVAAGAIRRKLSSRV